MGKLKRVKDMVFGEKFAFFLSYTLKSNSNNKTLKTGSPVALVGLVLTLWLTPAMPDAPTLSFQILQLQPYALCLA